MQVTREHYLRDDLPPGSELALPNYKGLPGESPLSAKEGALYTVIDTNVAIHELDLLADPFIKDVIVLTTVLEETKKRSIGCHTRLKSLINDASKRFFVFANENHKETYVSQEDDESINDRNDRAIRVASLWYARICPAANIVLVTNDRECASRADSDGLKAVTAKEYAGMLSARSPHLPELCSSGADDADMVLGDEAGKQRQIFEEHLPMSEITEGIKQQKVHQGALKVDSHNSKEAQVQTDGMDSNILISGKKSLNRAMEGDIVAVKLLPKEQWRSESNEIGNDETDVGLLDSDIDEITDETGGKEVGGQERRPTGYVVGIIRRNWRTRGYAASIEPPKGGQAYQDGVPRRILAIPVERQAPKIRINTRQAETLLDKRIVVAIDSWENDSEYPHGHYAQTIGKIGDKEAETSVTLHEFDIDNRQFTEAVHQCLPLLPWKYCNEASDPQREDLRDLSVISVDPPGAKDLDDALHARRLPNGNVEVGVHIADVTHFVSSGSALDVEASKRATTTYLVQKRIDMLPKALTEDICSLTAEVDRLAFSVVFELTDSGHVVQTRFIKSVIRSIAALSYEEAQARILEAKLDDERAQDAVAHSLKLLNGIAKSLRKKRNEDGALTLASPEVKFEIDTETHDPLDVGMYKTREANQMIEEFMLLANTTVARKIYASFPMLTLLRRHPTPPPSMFDQLVKSARAVGFKVDVSSSKKLSESLDNATIDGDPYFNNLVRMVATRCMTQARYFSSGDVPEAEHLHYGLAAPIYTHFTSPIRRYADVIAHRFLSAAMGLSKLPGTLREGQAISSLADTLNYRHRNAKLAGRASGELYMLLLFAGKGAVSEEARVLRVRSNGLIVFLPKYGLEGPAHFDRAGDGDSGLNTGKWYLSDDMMAVMNDEIGMRFTVFDRVQVSVSVEEQHAHRRRLLFTLKV